ncbi:uncharacterized protein LOC144549305 [Carex rostrata]
MAFFQELASAKPHINMPWLIAGDFNVTLNLNERSNIGYPMHHMNQFRAVVDRMELVDMPLQGRAYTWASARDNPTFVRLDRFLMSPAWVEEYPNTMQSAGPSNASDHCPLICTSLTKFPTSNIFRFENCWLRLDQFKQLVQTTWDSLPVATDPPSLAIKMARLTKQITRWKKDYKKLVKYQEKLCMEGIGWLTKQSETRQLTQVERLLQEMLTARHNQLVLMKEEKWKQRAKK